MTLSELYCVVIRLDSVARNRQHQYERAAVFERQDVRREKLCCIQDRIDEGMSAAQRHTQKKHAQTMRNQPERAHAHTGESARTHTHAHTHTRFQPHRPNVADDV